jgi:hypothetical protein
VKRDYLTAYDFNGFNDSDIGMIAIPENYIPIKPRIVEPDDANEEFFEKNPLEDTKFTKLDVQRQKADLIEKEVRDVVTDYYKKLNGMAVVIVHGIDMVILDGPSFEGQDKQEVDFLIINYSKQYIVNIEVKGSLTHAQVRGRGKSVITKAKEQLQKIKKLIEDWFPHLKGTWKFCSMLYCKFRDESVMNCTHCADFIAKTPEELKAKIKHMDEQMPVIPPNLDEVATEAPNNPVWKQAGKDRYIFNDGSPAGWRIGDKEKIKKP